MTTSTGFAVAQKIPDNFRNRTQRGENVDRVEALGEHEHEAVTGADLQSVSRRQLLHLIVRPGHAHESLARRLAKRDAEPMPGTEFTIASWISSTVLMKCDCPRITLADSGFVIATVLSSMGPPRMNRQWSMCPHRGLCSGSQHAVSRLCAYSCARPVWPMTLSEVVREWAP